MPIKYKIFIDKKLVYSVAENTVTLDDLLHHLEELADDPDYTAPMKKLVDFRKAQLVAISNEEVEKFTKKKLAFGNFFQEEMCAIVVDNDLDYGITRMHGMQIEFKNINTNSFRKIGDAIAWLNVELDEREMDSG